MDHLNLLDYQDAEKTISEGYRKMQHEIPMIEQILGKIGSKGEIINC